MHARLALLATLLKHLALSVATCSLVSAQARVHKVSPQFDAASGPAAGSLAGFGWGFRQQILIDEVHLAAVKGRSLLGLVVRRDLDSGRRRAGGTAALRISLAPASHAAARTAESFDANVATARSTVFDGLVVLPTSPEVNQPLNPWAPDNSVQINFTVAYPYTSGTLCIELEGRPSAQNPPDYWPVDHVLAGSPGSFVEFGTSCSAFAAQGITLTAESTGLQIGSSVRLIGFGRSGARPLMLVGVNAIPIGVDLAPIGAPGCKRYLDALLAIPLLYSPPVVANNAAYLNFAAQIPPDQSLAGTRAVFQCADLETHLQPPWSNAAGLATSNGLEIQISIVPPALGMAVVRSAVVQPTTPMPSKGSVDVEAAPVLRLLH